MVLVQVSLYICQGQQRQVFDRVLVSEDVVKAASPTQCMAWIIRPIITIDNVALCNKQCLVIIRIFKKAT